MIKNTGKYYEKFVQTIQQTLLNADKFISGKTVLVELDKKLVNNAGVSRQFDVYFEFEAGGHLYRTVIECKDYASAIKAEKIDAFLGKTAGIPGNDSNLLIVFYVQIMPDDFVMQLHRF
ncbi:hypothetical protein FHC51_20555 [Leclercia sp. EC_58]|uniref:hypothetical protein n=1 Tax=Leclercia sp. EC_58 TaxID=2584090 RepID=UPI001C708CD4|nr:hypothetical protein [Leclercia sp. EC_58]MBW9402167.1 hypothetical protein [Leclercia sp. EC_58]